MPEFLSVKRFEEFLENELSLRLGLGKEVQKLGSNMSRITAVHDAEDLLDGLVVEDRRRRVENQEGMGQEVRNNIQQLRERLDALAKEIQLEVYGRDREKQLLIDLLLDSGNEEVLSVIPIVGMGGVGKTTLAQLVYNDQVVVAHFGLRMWVHVSENFDVGKLLKEILESAIKGPTEQLSMELSQCRLQEELSGKRYLLVLDDVWNEDPAEWRRLKELLPCGAIGSKILVTTRSARVARIMNALPTPFLGVLSAVESWSLFVRLANPPPMCVAIGREMVDKCGGLPLAIRTLGGLMSTKETVSEWESLRDNSFLWKPEDSYEEILPILQLSYDHLTPSLKQCFAFCAVIPKGYVFYKDELIKQWIAQSFIHSDDENELLEEEGEKYFNELLRRSLFQQVDLGNIYSQPYKMHDLIHDLLKSVAGKECLVVEASMMNDLTRHLALFNDETRHLALWNDEWAGELKNLDALKKCKQLCSMITYGSIDINVCLSFRCLRVLDLSHNSRIGFLPNSIDKLRHLRYLDISYTGITELPKTICNLHNLQTLRVLGIRLRKLPKNMKRMISLRHVEFDGWLNDLSLPKGIGELTFLRTLPKFIIAKESGAQIEELKGLNLLWGNIHIGGLDNITSVGCAGEADLLKAKKHLNSLKLSWSGDETVAAEGNAKKVIEVLEPHSDLKELSVENYTGLGFPSWMMKKLTNLKKVSLSSCKRCEQLPPLGQLDFLESLEIDTMDAVKHIVEFDGSHNYKDLFPSLKDLHLKIMPNLEGWSSPQEDGDGDEQGRERHNQVIFKSLHTLKIHDCPKLARPPWLPLLPSLESLEIGGIGWDMIQIPISQSLMKVKLDKMPNLKRWSPQGADDDEQVVFNCLVELAVEECPTMVCLPHFLPSLEKLEISKSNEMLLASVANYISLSELFIDSLPEVKHLPEELGPNHTSLRKLSIIDCPKLISLSNQLENLLALKELIVDGCNDLVLSLPDGLQRQQQRSPPLTLNSLEVLEIRYSCEKQTSLPGDGIVLPSLKKLEIDSCKNIESLSADMLKNLTKLSIANSPKVWSSLVSLENLKSLESLSIYGCPASVMMKLLETMENLTSLTSLSIGGCPDMSSLPKSVKTFTSLIRLRISNCPGMRSLPEWVGDLTLLESLYIFNFPGMMSLPKGMQHLKNLRLLSIYGCPVLERRVQRNKGQDWHKVAHVPYIYIAEGIASQDSEWEESSGQCPHLLLHSLKKLEKLLPLPSCSSFSPSSSSPPST